MGFRVFLISGSLIYIGSPCRIKKNYCSDGGDGVVFASDDFATIGKEAVSVIGSV